MKSTNSFIIARYIAAFSQPSWEEEGCRCYTCGALTSSHTLSEQLSDPSGQFEDHLEKLGAVIQ